MAFLALLPGIVYSIVKTVACRFSSFKSLKKWDTDFEDKFWSRNSISNFCFPPFFLDIIQQSKSTSVSGVWGCFLEAVPHLIFCIHLTSVFQLLADSPYQHDDSSVYIILWERPPYPFFSNCWTKLMLQVVYNCWSYWLDRIWHFDQRCNADGEYSWKRSSERPLNIWTSDLSKTGFSTFVWLLAYTFGTGIAIWCGITYATAQVMRHLLVQHNGLHHIRPLQLSACPVKDALVARTIQTCKYNISPLA